MVYIRNRTRNRNFSKVGTGTVKNSYRYGSTTLFQLLCSLFFSDIFPWKGEGGGGGSQFREVELRRGLLQDVTGTRTVTADQISKYRNWGEKVENVRGLLFALLYKTTDGKLKKKCANLSRSRS